MESPIFASRVRQELPWHLLWQCVNQSVWAGDSALDPEASFVPQEFFFFQWNSLTNTGLTSSPAMARPPPHTHLSLHASQSHSWEAYGGWKGQEAPQCQEKQAETREGRGRENELGTAWWWIFTGASHLWQTGQLSRGHSRLWEPQRKAHTSWGSCYCVKFHHRGHCSLS